MTDLGKRPSLLRRLIAERRGNIAIMFGLAAIPMVIGVGLAIDISRGYAVRTRLSAALDDAGLALGSSPTTYTTAQLTARLKTFVFANFPATALGSVGTPSFVLTNNNGTITITGSATVPTTLMKLINVNTMNVAATSVITRGIQGLELAIVLDNTGSMLCGDGSGSNYSPCNTPDHMAGLISATRDSLLAPLFAQNADPTKLKISLVPYVTTVNAGAALNDKGVLAANIKKNAANHYVDLAGTQINDFSGNPITFDTTQTENTPQWRGCVIEDTPNNEDSSSPPAGFDVTEPAGGWTTPWIPFYWHPNSMSPGSAGYNNWYLGATVSGNTRPIGYPHTPGQLLSIWQQTTAGPNNGCPTPMLRLKQMDATAQTTMTNAVNALQAWAAGGTFIHEGMIWGWRSLSPNPPFADGVAYNLAAGLGGSWIKAIVLETDGVNESFTGQLTGFGFLSDNQLGSTSNTATVNGNLNTRLQTICTNMKAANIVIYTVAFGSGNSYLQNCATDPGKYILAANSAELATAFANIASQLNTLRLAM